MPNEISAPHDPIQMWERRVSLTVTIFKALAWVAPWIISGILFVVHFYQTQDGLVQSQAQSGTAIGGLKTKVEEQARELSELKGMVVSLTNQINADRTYKDQTAEHRRERGR